MQLTVIPDKSFIHINLIVYLLLHLASVFVILCLRYTRIGSFEKVDFPVGVCVSKVTIIVYGFNTLFDLIIKQLRYSWVT